MSNIGHFASVAIASADDPYAALRLRIGARTKIVILRRDFPPDLVAHCGDEQDWCSWHGTFGSFVLGHNRSLLLDNIRVAGTQTHQQLSRVVAQEREPSISPWPLSDWQG